MHLSGVLAVIKKLNARAVHLFMNGFVEWCHARGNYDPMTDNWPRDADVGFPRMHFFLLSN